MRILVLSFYYPPDLSAGSFRIKALVDALQIEGGQSIQIEVISSQPSRYHSYQPIAAEYEEHDRLRIHRIALPAHQNGMVDQAKAYGVFAKSVWSETNGKRWDLVVATSSRLMTAALGAQVAKQTGARLYLDIRDLFTDTMSGILADSALRHLMPAFLWLEKKTLNTADRVNVVSEGFLPHVKLIAPSQTYRTFTNGIDDQFLTPDFTKSTNHNHDLPLVVYAGNMGEGQGLHKIVPEAAHLLRGIACFRLIGDGSCREKLKKAVSESNLSNVEILDPLPRNELFEHYRQADVLFIHLNDQPAFRKVLPSKFFECVATGKSILAGVAGYPAEFLRTNAPDAEVFSPCDSVELVAALRRLLVSPRIINRTSFKESFSRESIMLKMARDVLDIGSGK